jgi:hypothetical protein
VGPPQVETLRAERDAVARQRGQAQAQLAEPGSHVADFSVRSPIDLRAGRAVRDEASALPRPDQRDKEERMPRGCLQAKGLRTERRVR